MTTAHSRIKAIFEALGTTANAFAKAHNLNAPTIYGLLNGTRTPGFDTLASICQVEPRISTDYLIRGEGEPLRNPVAVTNVPVVPQQTVNLTRQLERLQAEINQVFNQQLTYLGSPRSETEQIEPSPYPVSEPAAPITIKYNQSRELTILKRMIDNLDTTQRQYSLAFELQADPGQYKFQPEWVPNADNKTLNRVKAAYQSLSEDCSAEEFANTHRYYCLELLYYRGSQFVPTGLSFDEWRRWFNFHPAGFMESRLSYAHRSVDYFLTKANDYAVARHFVERYQAYRQIAVTPDESPEPVDPDPLVTDSQSSPGRPFRRCPVTGVNITHQRPNARYAGVITLRDLSRSDPARFDRLVSKHLAPDQMPDSTSGLSMRLATAVRKEGLVRFPNDEDE